MTILHILQGEYPQWLIWHLRHGGTWVAMHRHTGLTATTTSPTALTEAMTSLQLLLPDNRRPARHSPPADETPRWPDRPGGS